VYREPDRFLPERFLERSFSPFEYLPFGGGHRRCIGAAFATYEMAIVLGTLLKRYEFELLETRDVVSRRRNVTMGPSTGIRLRLIARRR
jgi:cytochrome P450